MSASRSAALPPEPGGEPEEPAVPERPAARPDDEGNAYQSMRAWLDGQTPTEEVVLSAEDGSTPASSVVDGDGDERDGLPRRDGDAKRGKRRKRRARRQQVAVGAAAKQLLAHVHNARASLGPLWRESGVRQQLLARFAWFAQLEQRLLARRAPPSGDVEPVAEPQGLRRLVRHNRLLSLLCGALLVLGVLYGGTRLLDVGPGLDDPSQQTVRPKTRVAAKQTPKPAERPASASEQALDSARAAALQALSHCAVAGAQRQRLLTALDGPGTVGDEQSMLAAREVVRFVDSYDKAGIGERLEALRARRQRLVAAVTPLLALLDERTEWAAAARRERLAQLAALQAQWRELREPQGRAEVDDVDRSIVMRERVAVLEAELDDGPVEDDLEALREHVRDVRGAIAGGADTAGAVSRAPAGRHEWLRDVGTMGSDDFEQRAYRIVDQDLAEAAQGMHEQASPKLLRYRIEAAQALLGDTQAMLRALDDAPRAALARLDREQQSANQRINDIYGSDTPRQWLDYAGCLSDTLLGQR